MVREAISAIWRCCGVAAVQSTSLPWAMAARRCSAISLVRLCLVLFMWTLYDTQNAERKLPWVWYDLG